MGRYARGECRECKREMLLKNKGLCVSCWKRSDRLPAGRPAVLVMVPLDPSPVTAEMAADYADAGARIGTKWARLLGVRDGYREDASQMAAEAALAAFARGAGYGLCCMAAVRAVRNAVRDGEVRTGPGPFSRSAVATADPPPYRRTYPRRRGRETLFSEIQVSHTTASVEDYVAGLRWVA